MFQFYSPLYPEGFRRGVCSCNIHILICRTFYSGKHADFFFLLFFMVVVRVFWFMERFKKEMSKIISVKTSDSNTWAKWKTNFEPGLIQCSDVYSRNVCKWVHFLIRSSTICTFKGAICPNLFKTFKNVLKNLKKQFFLERRCLCIV